MSITKYGYNPGLKTPKKHLPQAVLTELSAFVESESTERSERARDIADTFGLSIADVLDQLEELRKK